MEKRGEVWIAPEGYVPSGRMVDPAAAKFNASWQDDAVLEDATFLGAEAAIAWGRQRSAVVQIRLGHSFGTYFSAGDEHPPVEQDDPNWPVPVWPPEEPPAAGWWNRPSPPTLDQAAEVAESLDRGDTTAADAALWAEEQLALFAFDDRLDIETQRALAKILEAARRR